VGVAATGGNFILGKLNTADATSSLSSSVGGGSPALAATNTGGGPAASFTVNNTTIAPFKVNSHARVAGLNADQIDGIDKVVAAGGNGLGAAVPGKFTSGRQHVTSGGGPSPLITVASVLNLTASNSGTHCSVEMENPGSDPGSYLLADDITSSTGSSFHTETLLPGTHVTFLFSVPGEIRWQMWQPGAASTSARVISGQIEVAQSGTDCEFSATMYQGGA
jgi:hypothetical protein